MATLISLNDVLLIAVAVALGLLLLLRPKRRPPRGHKTAFDAAVGFETKFVAEKKSQDGSEALRVEKSVSHSYSSDFSDAGEFSYRTTGPSSVGDAGAAKVCP